MATFRPVNTATLAPDLYNRNGEETTPTTPRPNTAPSIGPQPVTRMDDATTPTRATFGASALASQRALPASPFPAAISIPESAAATENKPLSRGGSQHSTKSRDSQDVDMDDSDEGEEGSDDESINADGSRSSKKKKSQRFYCTDYPPCNLSFTRSEHLARHIRKHTGERPFQCHCSRRFSRLDNLRQHAQTVHVNEEIPTDSLAATGTRFQRQVRTERVRPSSSRSRGPTAGSQGTPGRGHNRNSLSASSISSVGSAYSPRDDVRRRPPPLVMAGDHRARLPQEMYPPDSPSNQYQSYRAQSPGGFSTPTSATFSTDQRSPRWSSGMQSPMSSTSRTASIYAGHRTPGRRLSVPSAGNPFQSPLSGSYGASMFGPMNSSNSGAFSPSSSMLASPTASSSGSSIFARRESGSIASDEAWRRRTWHPETYSHFTSRLHQVSYYASGNPPQPPVVPSNGTLQQQTMRLPGIESFDPIPRPVTPVRRQPSPMLIDTPSRGPLPQPRDPYRDDRAGNSQWDMGLHRNLTRLDIAQVTPPADEAGSWGSEANRALQAKAEQSRAPPAVRFEESTYSARSRPSSYHQHQHTISAPPITPKESKRHGWYQGPMSTQTMSPYDSRGQRTSPEDSSSSEGGVPGTPSSASVTESNPSIVHHGGWVESNRSESFSQHSRLPTHAPNGYQSFPQQNGAESHPYAPSSLQAPSTPHQHQAPKSIDNNMLRLEALVAVATSEENVAAAY